MEKSNHYDSGFNAIANSQVSNTSQEQKEDILSKLDYLLDTYTEEKIKFNSDLQAVMKQLRRKRREFDATRFFVLVVGPVKSGKSTLVNIFARKYVSPTAYKECTALPTIIGESKGEHLNKIIQYFPTDGYNSDEAKKETFDYIVDVIRGVENQDVLNGRVRKVSSELTTEKVKEIITLYHDDLEEKKDLVVSMGIDGGGFIDDEIMLIDMPGLDGSKIHIDNTIVYRNMAQRADVVFFVQSTTSAINKSSIDFLKELFHEKEGKVPVWLIHNIHDSQHFLKDDEKKKADIKEQIDLGKKRVKEEFGIEKFEDKVLNLGKIYAAINEPERVTEEKREEIKAAFDDYVKFEKKLIETLKNERQQIKDKINIGKAKDTITESITIIDKIIEQTKTYKTNVLNNIRDVNNLSSKLDSVKIYDTEFLTTYDNLLVSEHIENSWKTKIEKSFNDSRPKNGNKISGKELIEKYDKISAECLNEMPVGVGTQFRTQLCNSLNHAISEPLTSVISEIENHLNKCLQTETISLSKNVDTKALNTTVTEFPTDYDDITEKERHWYTLGFKTKTQYDRQQQQEYLDNHKNRIINAIPLKLQEYREILKNDFKTIRDNYISSLKETINEYALRYENEQNVELEKLEKEICIMTELKNDFKKDSNEFRKQK